jgi:N-hydroxyarylamine O-acetyltransferase
MINVEKYLERINFKGDINNSIDTLFELNKCHLYSVPFENLDIKNNVKIILDIEKIYDKIVNQHRGGFCYELNGLFSELLKIAGFKIDIISCNVHFVESNEYGADYDHMGIIVKDKKTWFTDVGYGDNIIEPLRLIMDIPQKQYGVTYKFTKLNNEEILLERLNTKNEYNKMYKFTLKPRRFVEYSGMCEYHQTSPDSHFTKERICSKATPSGRISLSDKYLIITENGIKKETEVIDENDFSIKLKKYFGIVL